MVRGVYRVVSENYNNNFFSDFQTLKINSRGNLVREGGGAVGGWWSWCWKNFQKLIEGEETIIWDPREHNI